MNRSYPQDASHYLELARLIEAGKLEERTRNRVNKTRALKHVQSERSFQCSHENSKWS